MKEMWGTDAGKKVLQYLQDDCTSCLNALMAFETLSQDEIRGYLAKYRSNVTVLSTLRYSTNVDEVQEMLDKAVKEEVRNR